MRSKANKFVMFMLVLCMAISMFSVNAFAADESTAIDDCTRVVEAYDLDDAEDYINDDDASTYPTCSKEGYLFAGWYTQEACDENSYWGQEEPGEKVYALFVPSHVLSVKAQISGNLLDGDTSDDDTASIRFVTTVDTLYYRQAGFQISYVGSDGTTKNATSSSNKVYKKLYAIGSTDTEYTEDDILEYTPGGTFCGLSTYFKACTIKNVGADYYTTPFTVMPFWKTMDGSIVYGETIIKSINDYFLADDVWVSSTNSNAADTVENGTEDKPFATLNYALGMVKNGGTVHVTGTYTAPSDFVWEDHDKTVTITGGTMDFTGVPTITIKEVATTALQINDSVKFTSTTLKFVNGEHIYANGNKLEIASDVTWGDTSAYVWIYGGTYNTTLKSDTNLVLSAGNYERVFGAGNYGDVTGDVNVTISGSVNTGIDYTNHTLTYAAFGGGENGSDVTGDINLTIADSTVLFDYIYGGGYGSGVKGDITVKFAGKSMSVYGGCRNGSVTGNTHLIMTGGFAEQLFGGCQASTVTVTSNVYGNTDVQVLGGTVDRRIYGGCYNDATETIESYTSLEFSFTWKSEYKVSGYSSVTIADDANLEFDYQKTYSKDIWITEVSISTKVDNTLSAFSRHSSVLDGETAVMIFNDDLYSSNSSKIKFDCEKLTCTSGAVTNFYDYLVIAQTGGQVYSTGEGLRIIPDSGKKATVRLGSTTGEVLHYTEEDSVCFLPELTSDTVTIYVMFADSTPSDVDTSDYEAKVNGGYYETLEEAVDAAKVLATEDTIPYVTLLKDAEVEATMAINDSTSIGVDGDGFTINRADKLVNGSIFTVSAGSELTVDDVVLDGRISSELAVTDLTALTGSTASLIYNEGTVNLENITAQYAVKTAIHGAVLQSGGTTDVVTVENSTFRYNKAPGQGAAIRMGGSTVKLEVTNSTFEYNEVYTLTTTAEDGTVSVSATGNGGAIGTHADTADIINCKFVGNTATGYSEKSDGCAGAIYSGTSSIVTITGTDENAVFSKNGVSYGNGGAVAVGSGKMTITGYTFEENTSTGHGGVIYSNGNLTKIKAVSCTFTGNTATGNGGVAYAGYYGTLIFGVDEDCTVEALAENNKAGGNGGVTAQGNSTVVKIIGYTLEGNTALNGGAVQANSDSASTTVIDTAFTSNKTAKVDGTDYAGNGGAINNLNTTGTLTVKDSSFTSNNAGKQGGAIYNNGTAVVQDTTFTSNESVNLGGAIVNSNTLTLTGTGKGTAIFEGNKNTGSNINGGAIYNGGTLNVTAYSFKTNTATGNGGAVCNYGVDPKFTDCQFTGNKGVNGAAVYSGGDKTIYFEVSENPIQKALFQSNIASGYGGAIGMGTGKVYVTGYEFTSNQASTTGGAIHHNQAGTDALIEIADSTFDDNESTKEGGAIYNKAPGTIKNTVFTNNEAKTAGGAIYNNAATITIVNSKFATNTSATQGGAVANASSGKLYLYATSEELGVTESDKATFEDNTSNNSTTGYGGGAIYHGSGTVEVKGYKFADNTAKSDGGAICARATITISGCTFNNNDASANGGGLWKRGSLTMTGSEFIGNTATGNGGAIYIDSTASTISNTNFTDNEAVSGGAIKHVCGSVATLNTCKFTDNTATSEGGAIAVGYATVTENTVTNEDETTTTTYTATYTSGTIQTTNCDFTSNAAPVGGAINCYASTLTATSCNFTSNTAIPSDASALNGLGGGAVNAVANSTATFNGIGTFTTNTATGYLGGAIYTTDAKLSVSGYTFDGNSAKYGGALYIDDVYEAYVDETLATDTITVTDSKFANNTTTSVGGAVYVEGRTLSLENKGETNVDSIFTTNTAPDAGAVYASNGGTIQATGYTFDNNTATTGNGGAILNYGPAPHLTSCSFTNNAAAKNGGAVYSGASATLTLDVSSEIANVDAEFIGNKANASGEEGSGYYGGGAVCIGSGKLDVDGYNFENNYAKSKGGAINKRGGQELEISNSTFDGNYSELVGGAIYSYTNTLDIDDTDFTNNYSVSQDGGAIYQIAKGTVTLDSQTESKFKGNYTDNTKETLGGALYVANASCGLTINGYTFESNSAYRGGAIWLVSGMTADVNTSKFTSNTASNEGGAIYVGEATLNAISTDFAGNEAPNGGAISVGVATETESTSTAEDGTETTTTEITYTDGTLTVENCDFTSNKATAGTAGAVYLISGTATLTSSDDSTFASNEAQAGNGGAINAINGTLKITGYVFSENTSYDEGGAIYNTATMTATGCTFDGNKANSTTKLAAGSTTNMGGGAIYNTGGSMTLKTSVFTRNESASLGGAVCNYNKANTITDCTFGGTDEDGNSLGNKAGTQGGAVYTGGGVTLTLTAGSNADMAICENNSANTNGGAVAAGSGTLNITGYTFTGNHANSQGGALNVNSGGTITQCTFIGNDADNVGGAFYTNKAPKVTSCVFKGNWADSQGGAVYTNGGAPTFTDCQFGGENDADGNTAKNGGAFYQGGGSSSATLTVSASPTVDALFQNNTATATSSMGGGGICIGNGTLTICGYEFKSNSATGFYGGAVHNNGSANQIYIYNSKFNLNYAKTNGGAVYNSTGTMTITDTAFDNNSAYDGGAIYSSGTLTLNVDDNATNAYFTDNSASRYGGAINIPSASAATLSVTGYKFDKNTASSHGGAVMLNNVNNAKYAGIQATFTECEFTRNSATSAGGAICNNQWATAYTTASSMTVTDCTFGGTDEDGNSLGNTAGTVGGAIRLNLTANATITGSTFSNNTATTAESGAIHNGVTNANCMLTVGTSTFTGSTSYDIYHDSGAKFTDNGGNTGENEDGTIKTN